MPENGIRSTYSQAPFMISMHDNGGQISTGTAFHYMFGGKRFIVTNWHNVSGLDFFSRRNLNTNARRPLWIEVHTALWQRAENLPSNGFSIFQRRVEIYAEPDAMLDPLWSEHPTLGSHGCDLVVVPDAKPALEPEFMHNSVNMISNMRVPVLPGEIAFVIGFPQGLTTGFGLPIWKSTFIASEPFYDVTVSGRHLPAFFLDGYTRPGMSGSPVFARFKGSWDTSAPYKPLDETEPGFWDRPDVALFGSEGTEFIGIYSGRIPEKEGEAALGLCWRRDAIEMTCGAAL